MDFASMYPAFKPSMAREAPSMTHTDTIIVRIRGNAATLSRNVYRTETKRAIPVVCVCVCVCVCVGVGVRARVRDLKGIPQFRYTRMAPAQLSLHQT